MVYVGIVIASFLAYKRTCKNASEIGVHEMKKRIGLFITILLASSLILSGCSVSKDKFDALQIENNTLKADNDNLRAQLVAAQTGYETANAVMQNKLDAITAESNAKSTELTASQVTNAQLQTTISGLNNQIKSLSDVNITNAYSITYQNHVYDWTLPIPFGTYYYYKTLSRPSDSTKYSVMLSDTKGDDLLNVVVNKIKDAALTYGLTKIDMINMVTIFVQTLPRTNKVVTTPFDNYARYPVETLLDNGGDCEDNSILAAAILTRLNCNVVFFVYNDLQHIALGIDYPPYSGLTGWDYQGTMYYYFETTGREGLQLGHSPSAYETVKPVIVPIK